MPISERVVSSNVECLVDLDYDKLVQDKTVSDLTAYSATEKV